MELQVGDRVVWQAPVPRAEGAGRVPWKRGLSGPWEVVSVRGHRLQLRLAADASARPVDAHAEDCVLVPGDMDDEPRASRDVVLEDASADEPLSIGQRVQGEGARREFVMQRRGRQFVLRIGDVVAYTKGRKICSFGRVTQVSVEEGLIGVHRYRPVTGSLRVKWVLAFLDEDGEVSETGTRPCLEQIRLKEVWSQRQRSRGMGLSQPAPAGSLIKRATAWWARVLRECSGHFADRTSVVGATVCWLSLQRHCGCRAMPRRGRSVAEVACQSASN